MDFVQKKYKIVLIGDASVGKSNICSQLCKNYFQSAYKPTLGCDFFVKVTNILKI